MRQVAEQAGVSHMTVSRVLRGERRVKAATVAKVRQAVATLGYRADPYLGALVAYRSKSRVRRATLAFLDCDRSTYSQAVLAGATAEAEHLGYHLEMHPYPRRNRDLVTLGRQLYHRGIEGLLFGPSHEAYTLPPWRWKSMAAVALSVLNHRPRLHAVGMHYFNGLQLGYEHLRSQGSRRIGLLLDPALEARSGHLWLGAYEVKARPRIPPCWLTKTGRAAEEEVKQWISRERVDGILTLHPQFHRLGVKTVYLNSFTPVPASTVIALDPREIGAEGICLLHRLLARRDLGLPDRPQTVLLDGVLHHCP